MASASGLHPESGGSIPSVPTEEPVAITDNGIKPGVVFVTERGQLAVALARFKRQGDSVGHGWYGVGFNGQRVTAKFPEFVAASINAYINLTYSEGTK